MSVIMMMALMAQVAPDKDPEASKFVMVLANRLYADCVKGKALTLDDGHEGVEVITRAAMTFCKDDRGTALVATTAWAGLAQDMTPPRASKVALAIVENIEKQSSDRTVLALLEARRAKRK
jgi:hypothetical protein